MYHICIAHIVHGNSDLPDSRVRGFTKYSTRLTNYSTLNLPKFLENISYVLNLAERLKDAGWTSSYRANV